MVLTFGIYLMNGNTTWHFPSLKCYRGLSGWQYRLFYCILTVTLQMLLWAALTFMIFLLLVFCLLKKFYKRASFHKRASYRNTFQQTLFILSSFPPGDKLRVQMAFFEDITFIYIFINLDRQFSQ